MSRPMKLFAMRRCLAGRPGKEEGRRPCRRPSLRVRTTPPRTGEDTRTSARAAGATPSRPSGTVGAIPRLRQERRHDVDRADRGSGQVTGADPAAERTRSGSAGSDAGCRRGPRRPSRSCRRPGWRSRRHRSARPPCSPARPRASGEPGPFAVTDAIRLPADRGLRRSKWSPWRTQTADTPGMAAMMPTASRDLGSAEGSVSHADEHGCRSRTSATGCRCRRAAGGRAAGSGRCRRRVSP